MELNNLTWHELKQKIFTDQKLINLRTNLTETQIEELLFHPEWNTFPAYFKEWVEMEVNNQNSGLLVINFIN